MMPFNSGLKKHLSKIPQISSGDSTLDELLRGGYHKDLIYLLYGDIKRTTSVLLTTAVIAQKSRRQGGLGEGAKIAWIDANNRFNPYTVSKYAVSHHLSPRIVLENILISRAFTFDQTVEILENRLSQLPQVKVVLISGITTLFPSYEKHNFEELLRAINGVKQLLQRTKPLIVITAPLNEFSSFRPKGGKILSHFGSVLVSIKDDERFFEYSLVQHPYLPERKFKKWKPREPKKKPPLRNMTLEQWLA